MWLSGVWENYQVDQMMVCVCVVVVGRNKGKCEERTVRPFQLDWIAERSGCLLRTERAAP